MVTKRKRWYFRTPGNFYALGPIEAPSRKAARLWVLEFLGVDRLPRRTEIWPAAD